MNHRQSKGSPPNEDLEKNIPSKVKTIKIHPKTSSLSIDDGSDYFSFFSRLRLDLSFLK